MTINTPRCVIRPVRARDAEALFDIRQRVARFQGRTDRTLDETRAMYADMESREPGGQPGWHQFVVEDRESTIVGDIGVNFESPLPRQVEIGYSLHPDHWGRGYASEALAALLDHLFASRDLHRAIAITGAENHRSRTLLERLGFRHEGTMIQSWWERDEERWSDEVAYAVINSEWRSRQDGSGGGT